VKIALAHKRLDRRGGTETILYRTAEGLRDLGHDVHLFCGEFHIPPPAGTSIHKVPYWPLGRTARLLSFAFLSPKVIKRHGCDVVLGFGRMGSQDILRSGGGTHKLFLEKMAETGDLKRKLWYRLSPYHRCLLALEKHQFSAGSFKKVIAISEQVKKEIVGVYSVPPQNVAVIYNGIDLEQFHPRNRKVWSSEVRLRFGIPEGRPLVLFVGNGFRRKGLDVLLKAWAAPSLQDFFLLVVGSDPAMARYIRQARGQGLAGRVIFAGRDTGVERYYGAAELFALPSFQEAFGHSSLEALASGLPILVSARSGSSEILEGELREGIVQNLADPLELPRRIVQLLDQERWPHLSAAARRVAERYSWKRYFAQLESLLHEVRECRP
jgi:UDP-glucose:(heptosyl)LPS alpha-1,3-glucosyltransferase